jgi:uncharacterized membrane protein
VSSDDERDTSGSAVQPLQRAHFGEDFRRFFLRGLAALMPTLITLWLLIKVWDFLWDSLGQYIIWFISVVWLNLVKWKVARPIEPADIRWFFWAADEPRWTTRLLGVVLAVVLVYIVGLLVGNLIGRTLWKLGENGLFRIPLIRAIYPAVKQVTDFVLADKKAQFTASRVVAVEPDRVLRVRPGRPARGRRRPAADRRTGDAPARQRRRDRPVVRRGPGRREAAVPRRRRRRPPRTRRGHRK